MKNTYGVLVVDDSADDRFFLHRVMDDDARFKIIAEVENGRDAIDYLQGNGKWMDRAKYPLPDLVLLDLKMPGLGGFDVLQWLNRHPFPMLTVVVLSGSSLDSDKERCRQLGANAYYTKAFSSDGTKLMLQELKALLDQKHYSPTQQSVPKIQKFTPPN